MEAGLPRALEAGNQARLHRMVDQVVLLAGVGRYLTGRFEEAAALGTDAAAAARDRHDPMAQLWGLLVQAEARLRTDPVAPALAAALEAGGRPRQAGVPTIDAVRFQVAAARHHLAAGHPDAAWRWVRAA